MNIENHISDILQLYEFSMAIGKSLDYKSSCDSFLKLVLKRKHLNAAWIIENRSGKLISTYSIPLGKKIDVHASPEALSILDHITDYSIFNSNQVPGELFPIEIKVGRIIIYNLKQQGFLFLFSKGDAFGEKDMIQLKPVIDKFSMELKACESFKEQEILLHNLEVRNQELNDYAHMISHDLKSPLRSIDTLTAWLKYDYLDKFDEEGVRQLDLIRYSVERMDALINSILQYSSIDKNQTEAYEVDLNVILDDIISLIQIPEHISFLKDEMPTVKGDKFRMQQLFQNLIENAIKYNDKDEGLIEIRVKSRDDFWEFRVTDNGKGIDRVYYDKIFDVFSSLEDKNHSTGIGLSIVKKIVEFYQGKIWVESEPGKGTSFLFTLKK